MIATHPALTAIAIWLLGCGFLFAGNHVSGNINVLGGIGIICWIAAFAVWIGGDGRSPRNEDNWTDPSDHG